MAATNPNTAESYSTFWNSVPLNSGESSGKLEGDDTGADFPAATEAGPNGKTLDEAAQRGNSRRKPR